mgnify:CR=1 FL=1
MKQSEIQHQLMKFGEVPTPKAGNFPTLHTEDPKSKFNGAIMSSVAVGKKAATMSHERFRKSSEDKAKLADAKVGKTKLKGIHLGNDLRHLKGMLE